MIGLGCGQAQGAMRAGIKPTLDLNFLARAFSKPVAFSRASAGLFFGSNGQLQTAAIDAPRYEYDPVTLAPLGLLIEESRTNLLLRHIDATAYAGFCTASLGTIAAGPTVAGMALVTYTGDATSASHYGYGSGAPTYTATTQYTASQVVNRNNRDWVQVAVSANYSDSNAWANFNLVTGAWGTVGASVQAKTAQKLANGCWRLSMTFTTNAAPTSGAAFIVCPLDADTASRLPVSSAGSAVDWGYQQVEQASAPSSIILTAGTSVTRAADLCSLTDAALFAGAAGSIVVEGTFDAAASTTSLRNMMLLNDGGATNRVVLRMAQTSGVLDPAVVAGGVFQGLPSAGVSYAIAVGVLTKHAISWGSGQLQQSRDGANSIIASGQTMPSGLNRLDIGNQQNGGAQLCGHVRRIRYWPKQLPAATLQQLTK